MELIRISITTLPSNQFLLSCFSLTTVTRFVIFCMIWKSYEGPKIDRARCII